MLQLTAPLDFAYAYTNTTATQAVQIATDQQFYSGIVQATVLLTLTNPGGTARTIDLTTFHTSLAGVDVKEMYLQQVTSVTVTDYTAVTRQGISAINGSPINFTAYVPSGSHVEQRVSWTSLTGDTNFINAYKESTQPSLLSIYSSFESGHRSLVPSVDSTGRTLAKKGRLFGLTIAPGESKTFRLLITFPVGSTGEFVIETYDQATGTNLGLLDPWWNSSWNYSRIINVTNNAGATLQAGYTVNLTFDHASNVSAGKSNANGSDVRVVYNDSEIDRVNLTSWNTASTTIAFKLQANVSASSTDSTNYKLYYGNPNAGAPQADLNDVFMYAPPLSNVKGLWFAEKAANLSVLEDTSGNGNNGTIVNAAWTNGKFGGALYFNGTTSGYAQVPYSQSIGNLSSFTMGAWVKVDKLGVDHFIMGKDATAAGNRSYGIRIDGANNWYIELWNTTDAYASMATGPPGGTQTGVWYFFAFRYNGSKATQNVEAFFNGTKVGATATQTGPINNAPIALRIGLRGDNSYPMNGTIDQAFLYDRPLADAEIAAMYIATDPTTALQGEQTQASSATNITLSSPAFTPADGSPNTTFTFSVTLDNPEKDNVNLSLFINNASVNSSTFAWNASASLKWTGSSAGSYTYHWEAVNLAGNKTGRSPATGEAAGPEVGTIYTKNYTAPSGATKLVAGVYWYGLANASGNITVSLIQPNGTSIQEFGVSTVVEDYGTVDIALPAITYNVTAYSGYRELTVSSPAIGNWQLKVRHTDVTRVETRVRWS